MVKESGKPAHLTVLCEFRALYIDKFEKDASVRVQHQIGMITPLHCTALGKILMYFNNLKPKTPLDAHTSNTITHGNEFN